MKAKQFTIPDGATVGTTLLGTATIQHGKMVILGDLHSNDEQSLEKLNASVKELASPGQPMHVVKVEVLSRVTFLDSSVIAPPVTAEE